MKHVKKLSWSACDSLIHDELPTFMDTWLCITRPLRDATYLQSTGVTDDATADVSFADCEKLVQNELLQEVDSSACRAFCPSFCVEESLKKRRRWILWPRNLNDWWREKIQESSFIEKIQFPTVDSLRQRVLRNYARMFDFAAFFHQFPILPAAAAYYAIRVVENGITRYFIPRAIPTGGSQPPLVAQLLCLAIAQKAIKAAGQQGQVESDCFVDNVRFVGDDDEGLNDVEQHFKVILEQLGVTLNENDTRRVTTSERSSYTFLGIVWNHDERSLRLGEKTCGKLQEAIDHIKRARQLGSWPLQIALAVFGVCVWASSVLRQPRSYYYYIYKYIRRKSRNVINIHQSTSFWQSITTRWTEWAETLLNNEPDLFSEPTSTLVTDASLSGWAGILFQQGQPDRVVADSHRLHNLTANHINFLELRTVRLAVTALNLHDCVISVLVDNTSTMYQLRSTTAKPFKYNFELNKLFTTLSARRVKIQQVDYIESEANPADSWSRMFASST